MGRKGTFPNGCTIIDRTLTISFTTKSIHVFYCKQGNICPHFISARDVSGWIKDLMSSKLFLNNF